MCTVLRSLRTAQLPQAYVSVVDIVVSLIIAEDTNAPDIEIVVLSFDVSVAFLANFDTIASGTTLQARW